MIGIIRRDRERGLAVSSKNYWLNQILQRAATSAPPDPKRRTNTSHTYLLRSDSRNALATEKRAFTELEALGQVAVPAMIMLMDDRRELPLKEISLRNNGPLKNFEEFRHYGPRVVADAIDAILSQITEEDFGTIHNGASERERKAAIDGWRVYLHRKRFGTHKPAG